VTSHFIIVNFDDVTSLGFIMRFHVSQTDALKLGQATQLTADVELLDSASKDFLTFHAVSGSRTNLADHFYSFYRAADAIITFQSFLVGSVGQVVRRRRCRFS
jgi:hypothetical protein